MKKTFLIMMMFILLIPLVFATQKYGGETWTYSNFTKCDTLKVNITATDKIDEGEYKIISNCTEDKTNYWICDCYNNYNFTVQFHPGAVNNYTFLFNYAYSKVIEEQQSSGGGGSSSRSRRTKVCTSDWNCTEWGNCQSNNRATRTCNDLNECNATRPSEERYCYYVPKIISVEAQEEVIGQVEVTSPIEQPEPQEEKGMTLGWWILIGVFIVMVIIIIVFIGKSGESQ